MVPVSFSDDDSDVMEKFNIKVPITPDSLR